ncbi:MAG TPA: TauD/TfdA family dioxygenase [Alphaproteobacteria bacterium]|jgi:taurine dioxygenase|nr:TauD/TfdA family dioxygenase [Alphaproteobacteria bacterium]
MIIKPLAGNTAVEVSGIDLDRPLDAGTRKALLDAFIQAGILVFPGATGGPEAQLALSRCFGELQQHPVKEAWAEGYPELVDVSYRPGRPGESTVALYEVDGRCRGGWLPWHSDLRYMSKVNRGGILRAIKVPREGGRTGFIDQIAAYATLPESLRRRTDGLHVVYQVRPDFTQEKFGKPEGLRLVANTAVLESMAERIDRDFPPVVHPMVYAQAETGRKVLNVAPTSAVGIHEMPGGEGDALLREVLSYALDPALAYFHDWQENDLVLWDNWRTLHSAEGVPNDCVRIMQRTTIAGDYARGRRLSEMAS